MDGRDAFGMAYGNALNAIIIIISERPRFDLIQFVELRGVHIGRVVFLTASMMSLAFAHGVGPVK